MKYDYLKDDEYEIYEIGYLPKVELPEKENKKMTWKTELKSFLITFFVGFGLVLYDQLDSLTWEALKGGSYLGIIFAATRAGVKAVLELFLATWRKVV